MAEYVYGTDGKEGNWLTGEKVVRCRDCVYSTDYFYFHMPKGILRCNFFGHYEYTEDGNILVPAYVKPEGFCSNARKEDDIQ